MARNGFSAGLEALLARFSRDFSGILGKNMGFGTLLVLYTCTMHNTQNRQMRRLALREWHRLYPKAYQKYEGYLVSLTNSPEADYERGLSLDENYGNFFSAWAAIRAITRCKSVKEFIEEGYLTIQDLPEDLPAPRGNMGFEDYVSNLDAQQAKALFRALLAEIRYRHSRTIDKDASGWYRVCCDGILGYMGPNLWEAMTNARMYGERDAAYMLAVPVFYAAPLAGQKQDPNRPALYLGRINYTKQAYAIKLD